MNTDPNQPDCTCDDAYPPSKGLCHVHGTIPSKCPFSGFDAPAPGCECSICNYFQRLNEGEGLHEPQEYDDGNYGDHE